MAITNNYRRNDWGVSLVRRNTTSEESRPVDVVFVPVHPAHCLLSLAWHLTHNSNTDQCPVR